MTLTQCPYCQLQCFTDIESCLRCHQTFQPGLLQAYAITEEKAFSEKAHTLFLNLFLMGFAVLLFVLIQAYLNASQ